MSTATIAARAAHVSAAALPEVRSRRNVSHLALLGCAALFVAQALRMTADAGPMHLFELVFFIGGAMLVIGLSWVLPYAGMLLSAALGGAAWLFLDAEPMNLILGLAGVGTSLLFARAWMAERANAS